MYTKEFLSLQPTLEKVPCIYKKAIMYPVHTSFQVKILSLVPLCLDKVPHLRGTMIERISVSGMPNNPGRGMKQYLLLIIYQREGYL